MMSKTGKLEIKISVTDIDKMETLINILAKYQDDLPDELRESLKDIADCDSCEIGIEELQSRGIHTADVSVFVNGEKLDKVTSVNPILKRVAHYSGDALLYSFPKSAQMKNLDKIICEW
jgi:hypothetical protein